MACEKATFRESVSDIGGSWAYRIGLVLGDGSSLISAHKAFPLSTNIEFLIGADPLVFSTDRVRCRPLLGAVFANVEGFVGTGSGCSS